MNMKTSKKMRGFMCQSTVATAVCNVADPRSVIVPRNRPQLQRLINTTTKSAASTTANNKYSKLVVSHQPAPNNYIKPIKIKEHSANKVVEPKQTSLPSISDQVFQVVVMRVSIHCQGCAGKVKKHLSKMEGVTSFSIDQETQRVTVMGHISPMGVLESLSKVKRAELWPYNNVDQDQDRSKSINV